MNQLYAHKYIDTIYLKPIICFRIAFVDVILLQLYYPVINDL